MKIEDYKKALEEHDWFYGMTEDNNVYRQGLHNQEKLRELSKLSPEHEVAYLAKKDEMYKKLIS